MDNDKKVNAGKKASVWDEELELLKSILNKTELTETIKWGAPVFTYNNKNVLGLGGFKNYFAIWFFKGVFLEDKAGVLINANEENTKSLRQWRFTSISNINEKDILTYVNEAIKIERKGLEIDTEKKETVIPELLQQALEESPELYKAFNALPPYKQREYCEHIDSAKRELTKLSRLEKCKPQIVQGKGLNDKYR